MVIASALTSILVFLVASLVSGFWTGIFAMIIYGTVPVFVISSRVAMPENLIALLFISSVYLLLRFIKEGQYKFLLPIPLLAGVAGLSKPTGFFILPVSVFILYKITRKNKSRDKLFKYGVYLVLATLPFIIYFFYHGISLDPEIFWRITSIQSQRPIGFNSLTWLSITPSFGTILLKDSWYIFSLLSGLFFVFNPERGLKKYVSLVFVYWLLVIMISGGESDL